MRNEADCLVRWLFERVGVSDQPPVDLVELADRMGVESIKEAAMVEDGRLEQRMGAATIYVRDDLSGGRRQFTIAHELGHRLLLHPSAPATAYRRRLSGDDVERLCDDVAASILMPRHWVEAEFEGAARRLRTLRRMAAMSSSSLSASLVRLREVHQWSESLLRFSCYADRWRLAAPAGVPAALHGCIRTTDDTDRALAEIGSRTSADAIGELPLRVATSELTFRAEISVGRGSAVALLDLRRPTGHSMPS